MNPNVEVYVATHKPIDFPLPEYCKKIQVNAETNGQWPGCLHDNDSSDNISVKNPNYCELTALYSMWKNSKADIQGLFHYRRYLSRDDNPEKSMLFIRDSSICKNAISEQKIVDALKDSDVILSFPYTLCPLNTMEHLRRFVYPKDIQTMCSVIREHYSDYCESLEYIFSSEHMSGCNIFIARREFVDEYCAWLFEVLGEVEKRISLEGYDTQHKRIYGYMSEVLLNAYIHKHSLRSKYFHMIKIFPRNPVVNFLRNFPLCLNAVRTMRRFRLRKFTRLDKLLASHPEAETVKRYMLSSGALKAGDFLCLFGTYAVSDVRIAFFMPENENDGLIPALEEAMSAIKAETEKKGYDFIPRVILSSETHEDVRRSLFELGVRVIIR